MKKALGFFVLFLTGCASTPENRHAVQALHAVPDRPAKPSFDKFEEDERQLQESHKKNMTRQTNMNTSE